MKKWWLFILSFSLLSCGLEEFIYLEAPGGVSHEPFYNSEYDERYFKFNSAEKNTDKVENYGTAVYYKIYNNYQTALSNNSSIDSLNSSTNESAAAMRVIETLKYKPLGTNQGTKDPLIYNNDTKSKVGCRIRLTNYHEEIDNNNIAIISLDDGSTYIPLRSGNRWTFDFGRDDSDTLAQGLSKDVKNVVPKEGDDDVIFGTASDGNKWYVDMYAIAVGSDENFTQYYSQAVHLGMVPIDADNKHN